MNRGDILGAPRDHKAVLAGRGVAGLVLFGSFVRDDASADIDIDLLVRFDGAAISKRCFGTQLHIEDLLGCPVDLVTDEVLRTELRPCVEREAIRV